MPNVPFCSLVGWTCLSFACDGRYFYFKKEIHVHARQWEVLLQGSTSKVCHGVWPARTEVFHSASASAEAAEESPKNLMRQNYNSDFKTRWYMTIGIVSHHKAKSYPLHRGFPWFTHRSHYLHFIRRILCSFYSSLLYV